MDEEHGTAPAPELVLLKSALTSRKKGAIRALVGALQPTVQTEVALVVLRRGAGDPRAVRAEIEDLVQDVWETFFRDDWHVLRQYSPDRGASLKTFVGLVSRRVAIDALRSGRKNPWREEPGTPRQLETAGPLPVSFEQRVQDRNLLDRVYQQLEDELGEKGRSALDSLFARDLSIDEASADTGMTKGALYSWKKRITKRARDIFARLSREDGSQ